MSKNMEQPERPQMTIQYGACALHAGELRLHTHTHTHTRTYSEYAILIAFSWQQWLRERASMLCDTYTAISNHIRYHVLLFTYLVYY